ncbi:MAG: thioredoxin family protein [Opitutae bacterium]|nr:thioredoxin family protein [Opitutae bacterium]
MVATSSTMLPLGTLAPKFSLPNVTDNSTINLENYSQSKAFVIAFVCNHCPFVIHLRDRFSSMGNEALENGVAVFAISSNDVENYPQDSPEKMATEARDAGYRFPYLYDETQEVAKAYKAACTPDFFVFDSSLHLAYRGQFDDSRPNNGKAVTGIDLQTAIDAVLRDEPAPEEQIPSLGCNIKWKVGQEPDYFG